MLLQQLAYSCWEPSIQVSRVCVLVVVTDLISASYSGYVRTGKLERFGRQQERVTGTADSTTEIKFGDHEKYQQKINRDLGIYWDTR